MYLPQTVGVLPRSPSRKKKTITNSRSPQRSFSNLTLQGLYFDLTKYYYVPQGSQAQPWTVSLKSFSSNPMLYILSTCLSCGRYIIPSYVPWLIYSRPVQQGVSKHNLKQTKQNVATCQFFGLLKETLYQNTVIADMFGYKVWCLLCICGSGNAKFPLKSQIVSKVLWTFECYLNAD